MDSVPVTVGMAAEASQYNALRADVITNVSAIAEVGPLIAAHVATAASIHGLGSGVSVLGTKAGAGLFIQYIAAAATWTHAGGQWEAHSAGGSWAVPWNNLLAVAVGAGVGSVSNTAYIGEFRNSKKSLTACTTTLYIYNAQGEATSMWAHFIGVGN